MPTYRHRKYGIELNVPEGTTDERVGVQMDTLAKEYESKAKGAAAKRTAEAAGMGALEEFMGPMGPSPAPGAPPGVPPTSGGPAGPIASPGASQGPTYASPLGALMGWEHSPEEAKAITGEPGFRNLSELLGQFVGEAALPASIAAGGGPGMVGKAVGGRMAAAGAGKFLTKAGTRGAELATGTAMTGAPIALEELLMGEAPMSAARHGATYGLLGEAAGVAGSKVLSKILGPSKKIVPEAMKAQEALIPMGATLTAGQLSKSRPIRLLETAAEYGLTSAGRMKKVHGRAHDAAQELLQQHLADLPERGGTVVSNAYKDLAKGSEDVVVDLLPAIAEARDLAAQHAGRIPEIDKVVEWVTTLPRRQVGGGVEGVAFGKVARLRSDLLAVERGSLGTLAPQKVHGVAERLAGKVDEAMEASLAGRPELLARWRGTNALARKAVFRDHVQDLVTRNTSEGHLNGRRLADQLERLTKAQRGKLDPGELTDLKEFANVLRQADAQNPEGTLRVAIQLAQAGVLGGLLYGEEKGKAAGLLALPYVIALGLTNPKSVKFLTAGFREAGTKAGKDAIQRAVATMAGRGLEKTGYRAPWETEE